MPDRPEEGERAQAPVIAWLTEKLGASVKRIDTQGAIVLLAGADAYKIRRAIKLPFLDYSTLEKRRIAAESEIAHNRDAAPMIYRDAVAVTRQGEGYEFAGAGQPVEWITRMWRFDEEATLDRLAERGELDAALMAKLARAIGASHARAPVRDAAPALSQLEKWIGQNRAAFAEHADLFPPELADRLDDRTREAFVAARPLLLRRGEAGFCRRCHGDLHLRNIVVISGEPALFDAIEFDDSIATGDVLYDLAFALMDLWERDFREAANALLNAYLARGPDAHFEALAALPLFLSVRAAIRAKVEAANRAHLAGAARKSVEDAARRYFTFAEKFLEDEPARLIAVGGLSGSGKTVLARALAPDLGRAPGAVWLRSDVERKRMLGVEEEVSLPDSAYSLEITAEVYARCQRRAAAALQAGQSVVLDATHGAGAARRASAEIARQAGAGFAGLWLEAPLEVRLQRIAARRGDVSDADVEVARAQRAEPLAEPSWIALDATRTPADLAASVRQDKAIWPRPRALL
jgi:hypothetical protein